MNTVLLHLSDLHFGADRVDADRVDREVVLARLVDTVRSLDNEWRPSVVCVTGDVGWAGRRQDYDAATTWLQGLLAAVSLEAKDLLLCPGNHDVDRGSVRYARPSSTEEVRRIFGEGVPPHLCEPFQEFATFAQAVGATQYAYAGSESALVGACEHKGVRFIALNSSWFARGPDDRNRLWIGFPILRRLESDGALLSPGAHCDGPVTIALVHHPPHWLHDEEHLSWGAGQGLIPYLAHRVHVILTGHTHEIVFGVHTRAEGALVLSGGASYAGANHPNTFNLIRLGDGGIAHRALQFDAASIEQEWRAERAARSYSFAGGGVTSPSFDPVANRPLREKLLIYAREYRQAKSRALRPEGALPEPIPLHVYARDEVLRPKPRPDGRYSFDEGHDVTPRPLAAAMEESRSSLLLGDLGSGKSTLVAQMAELLNAHDGQVCVLAPAHIFRGRNVEGPGNVLDVLSGFIHDVVAPSLPQVDLRALLGSQMSLAVIVDALDEIPVSDARTLLMSLRALPEHWPNVSVVASSRPVEIAGVSFEGWRILLPIALSDDQRDELLRAEGKARGLAASDIDRQVETARQRLQDRPQIGSMARTPLTIRLLYERLVGSDASGFPTIGELLYDLLIERLERWADRDGKPPSMEAFTTAVPDGHGRAELLALLALRMHAGERFSRDAVMQLFAAAPGLRTASPAARAQALAFFTWVHILAGEEQIQFPLQPLLEVAAAVGLLHQWTDGDQKAAGHADPSQWRVVSFAAAIARRLNRLEDVRDRISAYLNDVLNDEALTSVACYIVSEAQDRDLATLVLSRFDRMGPKPLHVLQDEWRASAIAIASTIRLAGEVGFDWFYREYLDPRIPTINTASRVDESVFHAWTELAIDDLTEKERDSLAKIAPPHLAANSAQTLHATALAVLAVPECLSVETRCVEIGKLLCDRVFRRRALDYLRGQAAAGHTEDVRKALEYHVREGYERSVAAAKLWMELSRAERPPALILRVVLRSRGDWGGHYFDRTWRDAVVAAIGLDAWLPFCRWALTDPETRVAAGAALELAEHDEVVLQVIGDRLLGALHDGGRIPEAEEVLRRLLRSEGEDGFRWLTRSIASGAHGNDWPHSGWWRVFLEELPKYSALAPRALATCVRGVGPYLIPRYADIRNAFRAHLEGALGEQYRVELLKALKRGTPRSRLGAAKILLACQSGMEADALVTAARLRGERMSHNHEWEAHLLCLRFADPVVAHLASVVPALSKPGRAFALAVLHRSGRRLADPDYRELISETVGGHNIGLDAAGGPSVLAESRARGFLIELLDHQDRRLAQYAARALHRHHEAQLAPELMARCLLLGVEHGTPRFDGLYQAFCRLREDAVLRRTIMALASEEETKSERPPLLGLIAAAIEDGQRWRDVIWQMLCDQSQIGHECDDYGEWLMQVGLRHKDVGSHIGRAAAGFIRDDRVQQSHWVDFRHWLALLAHEFVGLENDLLRSVLLSGQPIWGAAAAALVARLGRAPEDMPVRHRSGNDSAPSHLDDGEPANRGRLMELSRSGTSVPEELCPAIENGIRTRSLDQEFVDAVGRTGPTGQIVASAVGFVEGLVVKPIWYRQLVSFGGRDAESRCAKRLIHLGGLAHRANADRDSGPYVEAFARELLENYANSDVLVGLFDLQGCFKRGQAGQVIEKYTTMPHSHNRALGLRLARWLAAADLDEGLRNEVTGSLKRAAEVLDSLSIELDPTIDPVAFLVVSLGAWRLTGETTPETRRVFVRGLEILFSRIYSKDATPLSTLAIVGDLLEQVPRGAVLEALRETEYHRGEDVRTLALLLMRMADDKGTDS